jgi:curli biogenesis system outer membrane secretion channel CsgG
MIRHFSGVLLAFFLLPFFLSCTTGTVIQEEDTDVRFVFPDYQANGDEPSVLVVPFVNNSTLDFEFFGDNVSSIVSNALVNTKRYNVVDRRNVEAQLKELEFAVSDLANPSKALRIGEMVSARYLVGGVITHYSVKTERSTVGVGVMSRDGSGMGAGVTSKKGTMSFSAEVTITDVQTSKIVYASTWDGSFYTTNLDTGIEVFNVLVGSVAAKGESDIDFKDTIVGKVVKKAVYKGVTELINRKPF